MLGYSPDEVLNRSCWDFFHPDELPIARAKHGQGVELDKAAVMSYARMRDRAGYWLGCEVVFTIVYDCMVGCTSIYRRGLKSESTFFNILFYIASYSLRRTDRALEAPIIRRLFSNSPKDPRYHMLSHLSTKFTVDNKAQTHEPRAALFLNRFTRTNTIMYATNGLSDILGISGEELRGQSFYYCIQQNCLQDAVRSLEHAKTNDSIAYLRFWYRDPRHDEETYRDASAEMDLDNNYTAESMDGIRSDSNDRDVDGVAVQASSTVFSSAMDDESSADSQAVSSADSNAPADCPDESEPPPVEHQDSRTSSGESSNQPFTHEAVFGESRHHLSSASSVSNTSASEPDGFSPAPALHRRGRVELEAVISCTSDGLVVCLRRARPVPQISSTQRPTEQMYSNGLFAVPWSQQPMLPSVAQRPLFTTQPYHDAFLGRHVQPPLPATKVQPSDFMQSIRDIAVFAWALVGINGSLADHSTGKPRGESQPPAGPAIWQPYPNGVCEPEMQGRNTDQRNQEINHGIYEDHVFHQRYSSSYAEQAGHNSQSSAYSRHANFESGFGRPSQPDSNAMMVDGRPDRPDRNGMR